MAQEEERMMRQHPPIYEEVYLRGTSGGSAMRRPGLAPVYRNSSPAIEELSERFLKEEFDA